MAEFLITVKGMTCEHCKKAVHDALMALESVEEAQVDLSTGNVRITTANGRPSDEELHEAIEEAGYEIDARPR